MSRLDERQNEMRQRLGAQNPPTFRAHSVSPKTLRRMPSLVLRSAQQRSAANLHVRKVSERRRNPFTLRQVSASQDAETVKEVSGEKSPALPSVLAPEMFMGREVRRCRHCHLNQFMTGNGMCRKCRHSMIPEPQPIPDVQPVATVNQGYGRGSRPPITGAFIDVGFAVKLIRLANGMSQADLSRRGFVRTYISKVENGACIPTPPLVEKLAAALGASSYALITIAEASCAA